MFKEDKMGKKISGLIIGCFITFVGEMIYIFYNIDKCIASNIEEYSVGKGVLNVFQYEKIDGGFDFVIGPGIYIFAILGGVVVMGVMMLVFRGGDKIEEI